MRLRPQSSGPRFRRACAGRARRSRACRWQARTQDEYCEWALERNPEGKLIRVTFTTEVPEYFEHLFDTDQDALLAYYHAFVNPEVELSELTDEDGAYLRRNRWNDSTKVAPRIFSKE